MGMYLPFLEDELVNARFELSPASWSVWAVHQVEEGASPKFPAGDYEQSR